MTHFFTNPDENLQSTTENSDEEPCIVQKSEVIGSVTKIKNHDKDNLLKDQVLMLTLKKLSII